jgi:4-carboxymuconolactone decarboxylase
LTQSKQASASPEQQYIDEMVRTRGYALNYHKYLANADYAALMAANGLVAAVYLDQRMLDRRTKELLFVLSLTVMRADKHHIKSHIQVALSLGVTPTEILEAIEIALPEAGVVAFQTGFEAWCEAVGAEPLEPSIEGLPSQDGSVKSAESDVPQDGQA